PPGQLLQGTTPRSQSEVLSLLEPSPAASDLLLQGPENYTGTFVVCRLHLAAYWLPLLSQSELQPKSAPHFQPNKVLRSRQIRLVQYERFRPQPRSAEG